MLRRVATEPTRFALRSVELRSVESLRQVHVSALRSATARAHPAAIKQDEARCLEKRETTSVSAKPQRPNGELRHYAPLDPESPSFARTKFWRMTRIFCCP